jgi:flagellin
LSISAKLNSKNRSKDQAHRNVNQAVSIVQVMDGALSEMSSLVTRVRELAIQSASDTYSDRERKLIAIEAKQLVSELSRSAQSTKYQDNHLLRGDNKKLDIQVDTKDGKNHRISLDLAEFSQDPVALGIGDIALDNKHQARLSLVKLDYATKEISRSRAKAGAFMSRMQTTSGMLESGSISGKSAHSRIKDADYAKETAENVKNKLISNSQTMVQSQVNNMGSGLLKLLK